MNRSSAYANANIALIKYWGKSDQELNIPEAPSLSMTLELGTKVTIESISGPAHQAKVNEQDLARLSAYLELVRKHLPYQGFLSVRSESSVAMSAGLASSAAFFAALATALNEHFSWGLDQKNLSILARMGSASAARSIFGGFCALEGGVSHKEAFAYELDTLDVAMVIAIVSSDKKPISSRSAMNMTKATSPFYKCFIENQRSDFEKSKAAISNKDFKGLGELMEHSTLKMFATMWTAQPFINYWQPKSLELIQLVLDIRKNHGPIAYFTMDAGPNVKVLCPKEHHPLVFKLVNDSGLALNVKSSFLGQGSKVIQEHLHD